MSDCASRSVPCDKCTETVRYADMPSHKQNDCPFRLVECPNGCGKRGIQGKDLAVSLLYLLIV